MLARTCTNLPDRPRTSSDINPPINILDTTSNLKKRYEILLLKLKSQRVFVRSEQEEASKLPPCRLVPEVRPKPPIDR
jgi:hypothetical protein